MNRGLYHFHFLLALGIVLILAAAGIVFILSRPQFETEAAIRIQPAVAPILSGNPPPPGHFEPYKNTQVALMQSDRILTLAAQRIGEQNVDTDWLPDGPDILTQLKTAIQKDILSIQPDPKTELIHLRLRSRQPEQAQAIVNALLYAYMAVANTEDVVQNDQVMRILDEQKEVLEAEMGNLQHTIQTLENEYGSTEIRRKQERINEQIKSVHSALMEQSMERIRLEARMAVETARPQTPDRQQAIAELADQIAQAREEENRLRREMDKLDASRIDTLPGQVQMDELSDRRDRKKDLYEQICRRIEQTAMERQSPSRISIAYEAQSTRNGPNPILLVTILAVVGLLSGALLVSWLAFAFQPKEPIRKTGEKHERGSTDDETL
ncbi:MAG: hypothetical protein JW828_09900 [Sedimentisphaerales bacterium]|nr:hypothetical protein [Sedimentisphaerales bacterium]